MVEAWGAAMVPLAATVAVPMAATVAWSTLGAEVVGALVVGAILWAWLAATAPRRPERPLQGPTYERPADPQVHDTAPSPTEEPAADSDEGDLARTVPGASLRHAAPPSDPPTAQGGLVARLRGALARSREALQGRFDVLFAQPVDEDLLEELHDTLLLADVGVVTADKLVDGLRASAKKGVDGAALREELQQGMRDILTDVHRPLVPQGKPWVVLVVGVNGSGKTTTIGKLATRLRAEGKKVLLAAGDTYRAAAADQLQTWAERAGVELVRKDEGSDPGAVVYEAMDRAVAQGFDALIIDTAGRLQTTKPLMAELEKLRRVIGKHLDDAPHETLLVLDGTMGQNGLSQAKLFHEATPLTGVAITKLDGTAKGGMVLTIADELAVPVKLIGIGEGLEDLRDFEPEAFVEALA
jgi:fused signal recognition particle receptor